MKAFFLVKNRWTGSEYIHPKVFTSKEELNKAIGSWDTTNTIITVKYVSRGS